MAATLQLKVDALNKYRRVAGLDTQAKLAARMNFDQGSLSRVLRGDQTPGPKFIAALVSAFDGLSIDDLFEVVDPIGDEDPAA